MKITDPNMTADIRERIVGYLDGHLETLRGIQNAAADRAQKYLLFTNGGGVIATLSFMGSKIEIRENPSAWWVLGLFLSGVALCGLLTAVNYHTSSTNFSQWIKDRDGFVSGAIDHEEPTTKLMRRISITGWIAPLLGWLAFVSFIFGSAVALSRLNPGATNTESKIVAVTAPESSSAAVAVTAVVNEQQRAERHTELLTAIIAGATFLQVIALVATVVVMIRSSRRQLRAYMVMESGNIVNVANPVLAFPGQEIKSDAAVTNPRSGPVAKIFIKNTGQTPAFSVWHWGNICVREYPLTSELPPKPTFLSPITSIVGPGISTTKLFFLPNALTPQETADLRAGSKAIYVYGDIIYVDAFKRARRTEYRMMHHSMGGAIGVSTDFSFVEEGNRAT